MATTVKGAFQEYKTNLEITDRQTKLVSERRQGVQNALAAKLTLHPSELPKVIGSYDRHTLTRYLKEGDVDVMVVLHYGEHKDWDNADGTVKCLDKFKLVLQAAYPNTTMRRDQNCIVMQFSEFRMDVVPAFKHENGYYRIPDSVRKQWVSTNPFDFASGVTDINTKMSGYYVPLIKMVKGWNRDVDWPIRSFHLECMMFNRYKTYTQGYTYSSMMKVFFENLPSYVRGATYDPIMGDRVDGYLDNTAVKTRRQIAIDTAEDAKSASKAAYDLEESNPAESIRKWKALLGTFFPSYG